jgi:hypothetical protein
MGFVFHGVSIPLGKNLTVISRDHRIPPRWDSLDKSAGWVKEFAAGELCSLYLCGELKNFEAFIQKSDFLNL